MKRIFLFPLILAIYLPVQAGIPQSKNERYQVLRGNLYLDTEFFQINGQEMRLRLKVGREEFGSFQTRIKCKDFRSRDDVSGDKGKYKAITPLSFHYELANQLCFLTNAPGYIPELSPPAWAEKLILLRKTN